MLVLTPGLTGSAVLARRCEHNEHVQQCEP
jgi:hypothetical protein